MYITALSSRGIMPFNQLKAKKKNTAETYQTIIMRVSARQYPEKHQISE